MVYNNVILQTSTSVKPTLSCAVLMPFVATPTDPSIVRVNLDIKEMEKTAQVIFISVSGLLAWHQKLLVFVYLFALFSFISLQVKSIKKLKYFLLPLYLHQTVKRTILSEVWVKIFLPKPL